MKKFGIITLVTLAALVLLYLLGPTPKSPSYTLDFPTVPPMGELETYLAEQEAKHPIRPDNEAKIVWADSSHRRTEYVFLYLHGFTASEMEGAPINRNVPAYFGSNAFLARLCGHGLDTVDALINYSPDCLWESGKQALAIAEKLGDKVIIMSTSTGGTLAYFLAANFPEKVHALINMSPNVRVAAPSARILNDPWGFEIASLVFGGTQRIIHHPQPNAYLYWDTIHHLNAVVQLEELLETTMTEGTFEKVKAPTLTLYYYKNEEEKDQVVDVSVLQEVHDELGTPDSLKVTKALETPGNHVLASPIKSKDWESVQAEIIQFLLQKLHMKPKMAD